MTYHCTWSGDLGRYETAERTADSGGEHGERYVLREVNRGHTVKMGSKRLSGITGDLQRDLHVATRDISPSSCLLGGILGQAGGMFSYPLL